MPRYFISFDSGEQIVWERMTTWLNVQTPIDNLHSGYVVIESPLDMDDIAEAMYVLIGDGVVFLWDQDSHETRFVWRSGPIRSRLWGPPLQGGRVMREDGASPDSYRTTAVERALSGDGCSLD